MQKEKDFYQVSLKILLKNDQNETLLLKARPNGSLAGFYDLPGGRIDTDEFTIPYVDILQREIHEELGDIFCVIDPHPVAIGRHLIPASISKKDSDIHVLYVFFEANYISGEIKISSEHTSFTWIDLLKDEPETLFKSGILEGIRMYLSKNS